MLWIFLDMHDINPLKPNSDQHFTSPYSNTAESFTKIMRVKEMFANIWSFDRQMNSPCQNQKKHKEEFGEYG